jgi:glycerophosphoryl diester phosphodiesterase
MRWIAAIMLAALAVPATAQDVLRPLIIAHRGASGERPEHTLAAYERAIDQGADWLETDVEPTRDGVLVLRHESELSLSTDVADHARFADRKTTKTIEGGAFTGWFAEDFTLTELRSLRAKERIPEVRPANTRFDGLYPVPTLDELLQLMRAKEAERDHPVTLLLELKHPSYFAALGHDLGGLVLESLAQNGYGAGDPRIVIQSFELGVLCVLGQASEYRTVLLVDPLGGPADIAGMTYRAMLEPAALPMVKRCADGLGAHVALVLDAEGKATPTMAAARDAGMPVYAWTLRRENQFLPAQFRRGEGAGEPGDIEAFAKLLRQAGVAGIITDNPADLDAWLSREEVEAAAAAAAAALDE